MDDGSTGMRRRVARKVQITWKIIRITAAGMAWTGCQHGIIFLTFTA